MKLIFIRHAEPDYSIDSLTEKGWKEAECLSKRVEKWNMEKIYCSPLGRAKDTAKVALKNVKDKDGNSVFPEVLDWLKEFYIQVEDPETGKKRIPWDLVPAYWKNESSLIQNETWLNTKLMKSGDVQKNWDSVCSGIDKILSEYGYKREQNGIYSTNHDYVTSKDGQSTLGTHISTQNVYNDDVNLVFFCHLGVSFAVYSHLLGFSPVQLWQNFFVAPSSVTVLAVEERVKGEAVFRIERMGDISHLCTNGFSEPVSSSGLFARAFQS